VQADTELITIAPEPEIPNFPRPKEPTSPVTWIWDASIYEFVPVPSRVGQSSRFVKSSSNFVHLATDAAADDRQKPPIQTPSGEISPKTAVQPAFSVRAAATLSFSEAQTAGTMTKNMLPECCQQEILAEVKKLENQLPGELTYAIPPSAFTQGPKGAWSENINPNTRPVETGTDTPLSNVSNVIQNPPDVKKLIDGDGPALPDASGVPDLAAPNLPSSLDGAGGLGELSAPAGSQSQPRMRARIRKRSGILIRRVRRVVFKSPVLTVVLGRQLAKPTANALAIIARGGTVGTDAATAVPAPVPVPV